MMESHKIFWGEFFELYRSLPCLWKLKCPDYTKRRARNKAYAVLVDKLKDMYPDANKQMVLKKINIVRTCYRRELRKMRDSQNSGDASEDLYVPILWYFDALSFLADQDAEDADAECRKDKKIVDMKDYEHSDDSMGDDYMGDAEEFPEEQEDFSASSCKKAKQEVPKQPPRLHAKQMHVPRQEKLRQLQKSHKDQISQTIYTPSIKKQQIAPRREIEAVHQPRIDDESATISSSWGILYRDLDTHQKLYANKAINEVLYQGALGKLHEYSYKAIESSQQTKNGGVEDSPVITIDRVSFDDPEYLRRYQNIRDSNDALNHLKPLEEYAVRENHSIMGLLSQLEDSLRNTADFPDYFHSD